ncbi:MAG: hypothetical protein AB7F22_10465 [Reyranella sp.]|uniref:hypothetical protein n=1 Tax=Reyranella sp. TaxID=1929291 RepID=UPI003D115AB3
MSFDWRKEFERQHGRLPKRDPQSPSNRDASAGGEASGQGAVPPDAPATPPAGEGRVLSDHDPQIGPTGKKLVPAGREGPSPRGGGGPDEPGAPTAALTPPPCLPDPVLALLGAGDLAHLDAMAAEAGKPREQLAADLLADLLADDAEAHQPQGAAA